VVHKHEKYATSQHIAHGYLHTQILARSTQGVFVDLQMTPSPSALFARSDQPSSGTPFYHEANGVE